MKKYGVKLSQDQRQQLEQEVKTGNGPARQLTNARILLKADKGEQGPGWSDEQISEAIEVSVPTIERVRRRFVEHGLPDAITRRPQPERPSKRKIDGEQEAHLIALTCSAVPSGYDHWTMRLLADKMVALGYVEEVSYKTVWETLKKRTQAVAEEAMVPAPQSQW
jgi:transposase